MKRIIGFIGLMAGSIAGYSQDLIVQKNSQAIASKVIEITKNDIKYRPHKDSTGPLRSIPKEDVLMIYYQNGTQESFAKTTTVNQPTAKEVSESDTTGNTLESKNGFKLGDIVLYQGPETSKLRKGKIVAFTTTQVVVYAKLHRYVLDFNKVSKYVDQ